MTFIWSNEKAYDITQTANIKNQFWVVRYSYSPSSIKKVYNITSLNKNKPKSELWVKNLQELKIRQQESSQGIETTPEKSSVHK